MADRPRSLYPVVATTLAAFLLGAAVAGLLAVVLQPEEYRVVLRPVFENRLDDYKLVAVFENGLKKAEGCEAMVGVDHEKLCNFNYQQLPNFAQPFDITVLGLSPYLVKTVSVCLLKASLSHQPIRRSCQQFPAREEVAVGHGVEGEQIYWMEVEMQLTESGYWRGNIEPEVQFEVDRSWLVRLWIDYYFWPASALVLAAAIYTSVVFCAIASAAYLKQCRLEKLDDGERAARAARKAD